MKNIRLPKVLTSQTVVKFVVSIFAFASIVTIGAKAFDYDPFERYGKWLPWSESETEPWTEQKAIVLTGNPNFHMNQFGYYAQDFARGLPEWTLDTKVHVISDGVIEKVAGGNGEYNGGLGNYIVVDHGNGYKTRYSQMSYMVFTPADEGRPIRAGQELGMMGDSGNVTGPNLEFALYKGGYGNQYSVRAFDDGRTFEGEQLTFPWSSHNWESPVNQFEVQWSKYRSNTTTRPDDPDNPFDPPVIDPLDRYLQNYGYIFPAGMIAEPVNAATGNFVHRNVDTDLKTQIGPELKFERFYNSQDEYIGPFGRGWSDSFNIKILAHLDPNLPEGEIGGYLYTVKLADGRGETFKESDEDPNSFTNTFSRANDFNLGTLERFGEDGGYKFKYTSPEGDVYIFNSYRDMSTSPSTPSAYWGMVEQITDVRGHSLYFEYDEVTGNLIKASDDFTNHINFEYSDSDVLTKLSDQAGREVNYTYNYDGRLSEVQKSNGKKWVYTYDAQGRILTITDAEDKKFVDNTYDENGKVVGQLDASGNLVKIEYINETNLIGQETGNSIAKFTDSKGFITEYKHNDKKYLIEEKNALGNSKKYEYTDSGQITKKTLEGGQVFEFKRDDKGNITEEKRPDGEIIYSEYNSSGMLTKITDSTGSINFEYDDNNNLSKQIDQLGAETKYFYTDKGLIEKIIYPDLSEKSFKYNDQGLLAEESNSAANSSLKYDYDKGGNRTKVTDNIGRATKIDYDTFGNAVKIADPKNYSISYIYDKNGNVSEKIDEVGAITKYITDGNENITQITYANGTSESFEYDGNNNKTKFVDKNSNTYFYTYDVLGNLIKEEVFDTSGTKLTQHEYTYDANNRRIIEKDALGRETKFEYDPMGRLAKHINADGKVANFKYNLSGKVTEKTDFEGNLYKSEYNAKGYKTKEIDPQGGETKFKYDVNGRVISEIDPRGYETFFFYNQMGKLAGIKDANGFQSSYTYDAAGNLASQTNFAGETTTFKYDFNDNLIAQTDELGNTIQYNYDPRNQISEIIDPLGHKSIYKYDAVGQKSETINALGAKASYKYDSNGNLIEFISEDNASTKSQYDGLNRLIKSIDQKENYETYSYDSVGNLVTATNKNNQTITYEHDKLGRVIKAHDPLGQKEEYKYDNNGNLLESKDKLGFVTKYKYDNLNRLVELTNALGHKETYKYDLTGNLISHFDPKNQEIKYEYDGVGNNTKIIDRKGNETKFIYDGEKRTVQSINALGGKIEKNYDEAGRLTKEINENGNSVSYKYDPASNITSTINPNGFETKFEYDALNRKIQKIDAQSGVDEYIYDPIGRITKEIDRNGNPTQYKYDKAGNVIEVVKANNAVIKFDYDKVGNVTSLTNARGFTTEFKYDALNRQTQTKLANGVSLESTYDALDRVIKQKDGNNFDLEFKYDALGNKLKDIDQIENVTEYKYDPNKNLVEIKNRIGAITKFNYDANDLVTKQINAHGDTYENKYDALNRKIEEKNERGATAKFEYDGVGNLVKTIDAHTSEFFTKYDANNNPIEKIDALGNKTSYKYDSLDRLVDQINALNKVKSFKYDRVGNLLSITDENGNPTSFAYDKVYNQIKQTNALGYSKNFKFDLNANLTAATNENNHTITYAYDEIDRKINKTLAGGEVYQYKYDNNNNLTSEILPKGTVYTYKFDPRNLLTQAIDPLGNTQKKNYDALERVKTETTPEGETQEYIYDKLNRLTEVVDALSGKTKYEYDQVGNLLKEINANGKSTSYKYDLLNRQLEEVNALGNKWTSTYDKMSNIVEANNPENRKVSITYDALYRPTVQASADDTVKFEYDNVGNAVNLTNKNVSYNFAYDKVYQNTLTKDNRGYTTNFAYDPAGNRTEVVYPDGRKAEYKYNVNELTTSMSLLHNGDEESAVNPQELVTTFDYDKNLNLVKQVNPNTTQSLTHFDNADRIVGVENQIKSTDQYINFNKYEYTLNKNGDKIKKQTSGFVDNFDLCENIDNTGSDGHNPDDCANGQKADTQTIAQIETFTYDKLRRVVNAKTETGSDFKNLNRIKEEKWAYDAVGNRLKYDLKGSQPVNYTYNDINQLTKDSQYKYTYDKNGNRLSKTSNDNNEYYNFTYNSLDQLAKVKAQTPKGIVYRGNSNNIKSRIKFDFDYLYDGLGRRTSKVNNTNYVDCQGESEHGGDIPPFDCDNGTGNDNRDKKANTYPATSVPYYGLKRTDYVYDQQTWETLSEYLDRVDFPDPNQPVNTNSPQVPDEEDYFDLHTNYYKLGMQIIAAENIADRPMPKLYECPGNGENDGDLNWFDCDNGAGNDESAPSESVLESTEESTLPDSQIIEEASPTVSEDPHGDNKNVRPASILVNYRNSNQLLSYFGYDGLGSVVSQTAYRFKYNADYENEKLIPEVLQPRIYNIGLYDAYGQLNKFSFDPTGEGRDPYYIPQYPYAYGFNDWNNKSYTTKELDVETGNYFYGSRYYDPTIGNWNKQDTYRGEIQDPMSRHRYMFVKDNPVNQIDKYGFNEVTFKGYLDNISDDYSTAIKNNEDSLSYAQGEVTRLNGIIPGLQANMNRAWWGAYNARMVFRNHTQMVSVLGRLARRGYEMDYASVGNYLNGRIQETGHTYAVKQQQYVVAATNYSTAVATRDAYQAAIPVIQDNITMLKDMSAKFEGLKVDLINMYDKSYQYGYEGAEYSLTSSDFSVDNDFSMFLKRSGDEYSDLTSKLGDHLSILYGLDPKDAVTKADSIFSGFMKENYVSGLNTGRTDYIAELERKAAEEQRNQGLFKIAVGTVVGIGGVACAVATAGIGSAACAVGAVAVFTAVTTQAVVTYDNHKIASGEEGFLDPEFKQNLNTFSDVALISGTTLIGAGGALVLMAPGATASSLFFGAIANPTSGGLMLSGGLGIYSTSLGVVGCGNRISTGNDCSVNDYAMIAATGFTSMYTFGAGGNTATQTYIVNSNLSDPRSGKDFTQAGRQEVISKNQEQYGETTCVNCGVKTISGSGNIYPNSTNVDHSFPKALGGAGSPEFGQVLCRTCNIIKSDNYDFGLYYSYPTSQVLLEYQLMLNAELNYYVQQD